MPPEPTVTVGMAVYNGAATIAESIRSVLDESFTDIELLLVDDGSTDDSCAVIESFTDPRLRLLRNDGNQGLVATRNRIVREARGRYLAWLDQDDLSAADRMQTQVAYLDSHPQVALCAGWTAMLVGEATNPSRSIERYPQSAQAIRATMLFLNPIACNTVMMRQEPLRGAEPFRTSFGNSLDYDLWSRMSDTLEIVNLPKVLGSYRIHAGQTSQGAALARMNRHALDVQIELAERAMALRMSTADEEVHGRATTAPLEIDDADLLASIADWFTRLRAANGAAQTGRSFDRRSFDQALTRQWTTVCLAARRSLGSTVAARAALSGARRIGLPASAVLASVREGVARRQGRAGVR